MKTTSNYQAYKQAKARKNKYNSQNVEPKPILQQKQDLPLAPIPSEQTKTRTVGRIRKNSLTSNISQPQSTAPTTKSHHPNPLQQSDLPNKLKTTQLKKYNYSDELLTKIKASQMLDFNSQNPKTTITNTQNIMPISTVSSSLFVKNKEYLSVQNSHAGICQDKVDLLLDSFQERKNKIDRQIKAIKNKKVYELQVQDKQCKVDISGGQTPKFASTKPKSIPKCDSMKLKPHRNSKNSDFISAILTQIELDQQLRTSKHKIKQHQKPQISQLLKLKYKISDVGALTLQPQQFDPYHSSPQMRIESLADQIAQTYKNSQMHWKTKIKNRFERVLLEELYGKLEGEKEKGCVSLKGFVRELGIILQNDRYLRNRDLFRIYGRIQPFSKERFIDQLGNKNPLF